MFMLSDFKISPSICAVTKNFKDDRKFSVILKKGSKTDGFEENSITNAAKPLVYFASLFGTQMIRYIKNDIIKVNIPSRIYSIFIIVIIIALLIFVKPISWHDTISDVPLNILTKTFGFLIIIEVMYSIFIASFGNSSLYVDLYKTLNDIDEYFGTSKTKFIKVRIVCSMLITFPILQVFCTFWLRKFNIRNISSHLAFFLILLQGSIISFFVISIYVEHLMLNNLLVKKIKKTLSPQKEFIFGDSICDIIFKKMLVDRQSLEKKLNSHYCWFELMQIYDKISDAVNLFNKMYAGQVFIMFNTWLVCTLLTICRSLSPTVKYSDVIINDLFMYISINSRPIFLAKMCQLFMKERSKTLAILQHNLVYRTDEAYFSQIQTMIELVETRKLELSTNVFIVDPRMVMEFTGRVLSYTVLMIQYFYMHVFLK